MKKLIPTLLFSTLMTTAVFAGTIQTDANTVPLTVNDQDFNGEYPAYLVDGTTLISDQDLTTIIGTTERFDTQAFVAKNDAGAKVVFYPLRAVIENSNGVVEWNADDMSCDITTGTTETSVIDGVTLSESILSTNGKIPVNIDGTNTYLTINSVAPVVAIDNDEEFALKANEMLMANQVKAFELLQSADKTTTKEVFTNELTIDSNYEILSNENGQVSIIIETVITNNDKMSKTETTVNIDFNTKSVKVTK